MVSAPCNVNGVEAAPERENFVPLPAPTLEESSSESISTESQRPPPCSTNAWLTLRQGRATKVAALAGVNESESARAQRKADRFDLGEVFLEIALVISSLALLSRKRFYWFLGIISGVAGLGIAATGLLLH